MVSEMVIATADDNGALSAITTDDDRKYVVANAPTGYIPRARYRVMATFYPTDGGKVSLRELALCHVLRDSTSCVRHDPTSVVSAWRGGRFINMQLSPSTRGERTHYWGFAIDSVVGRVHHVSLHHGQNDDPYAYSTTVYASLPIDSTHAAAGDTIVLTVHTGKDIHSWNFVR